MMGWPYANHLHLAPDNLTVAPSRMVGMSASVIFPCTIKSRRRVLLAAAHHSWDIAATNRSTMMYSEDLSDAEQGPK